MLKTIRSRLLLAAVSGVALTLSLLAVAAVTLNQVAATSTRLTDTDFPEILLAQRMAVASYGLVQRVPELMAGDSAIGLAGTGTARHMGRQALEQQIADVRSVIATIQAAERNADHPHLTRLAAHADAIEASIDRLRTTADKLTALHQDYRTAQQRYQRHLRRLRGVISRHPAPLIALEGDDHRTLALVERAESLLATIDLGAAAQEYARRRAAFLGSLDTLTATFSALPADALQAPRAALRTLTSQSTAGADPFTLAGRYQNVRALLSTTYAQILGESALLNQAAVALSRTKLSAAQDDLARLVETSSRGRLGLWVLAGVIFAGGALVYWWLIERGLLARMATLRQRVQAGRAGDFDVVIPIEGEDEFSDMADALRYFLATIRRRTDELVETVAQLHATRDELVQAEKMAALGQLVAGVAHEINTPLGVAVTAASSLGENMAGVSRAAADGRLDRVAFDRFLADGNEASALILSNLDRAAELIRSFKQVAVDRSSDAARLVVVKDYLDDVVRSLAPSLRNAGAIRIDIHGPHTLQAQIRPGALSQVITNLVMNSVVHGFHGRTHGTITITVTQDRDWLQLIYEDDGHGIPADIERRIFEPFFTTRRGQGGSGLGMHIIHNIVHGTLGGSIFCAGRPGVGARFEITIPLQEPDHVDNTPANPD